MNSVVLKTHPACYCWNANFIINIENTNDVMNYGPSVGNFASRFIHFLLFLKNHICLIFFVIHLYSEQKMQ